MTSERESLIDELRTELGRVRAALVESMDWGWSVYIPPDEVVARCEAALGLTDTIAEFLCNGAVSSSDQRTRHQRTRLQRTQPEAA
jgi:hypothetical protein